MAIKHTDSARPATHYTASDSARGGALRLLGTWEKNGTYSNIALDTYLSGCRLSAADRGLLTALFYGVIERKLTLDYIIDTLSADPNRVDAPTRMTLRLGLYQLRYMDKIPPHAAVDETVELAPRKSRGFVNAILRTYLRRGGEIAFPAREKDIVGYLSLTYSMPAPLCRKFLSFYSPEKTEAVFAAFLAGKRETDLRVNTLKTTKEALAERLTACGATVSPCRTAPSGLRVSGVPLSALSLGDGDFFVQDEASQLCVRALDAHPGETVIDACACPGSKSFGAAIDMENRGRVLSFDLHENKLSLVRAGAERLGITILTAAAHDGRFFQPSLEETADRVLCDVPCSGYGVIGKKPEIRYKDPTECAGLPDIQLAILENNSRYVKRGGVLVYSTCTLLPEENEENVARFLARHPAFVAESMRTFTPDADGTDGFFVCRMRRT